MSPAMPQPAPCPAPPVASFRPPLTPRQRAERMVAEICGRHGCTVEEMQLGLRQRHVAAARGAACVALRAAGYSRASIASLAGLAHAEVVTSCIRNARLRQRREAAPRNPRWREQAQLLADTLARIAALAGPDHPAIAAEADKALRAALHRTGLRPTTP
jgi:hypothetical protein